MTNTEENNIDEETIRKIGLRRSDEPLNAQIAAASRVFEYPHLDSVYIMESDLYGNKMPKDSCFLAFNSHHGMIGKHLYVKKLKNASVDEIQEIVKANAEG